MVVSPARFYVPYTGLSQAYIMKLSLRINSKNASQLPEITRNRNKHPNVQICSENAGKHCYFDVTVLLVDVESTK